MAQENSVSVPNSGTAPIRVIQMTEMVNGVATVVYAQVVALTDENGNVLSSTYDRIERRFDEVAMMRGADAFFRTNARSVERTPTVDRRGNYDRGSSR